MPLTEHEKLHINAVIAEADGSLVKSIEDRDKLAGYRNLSRQQYDDYLEKVKTKATVILDSKVFPDLKDASDIHDYLEGNIES